MPSPPLQPDLYPDFLLIEMPQKGKTSTQPQRPASHAASPSRGDPPSCSDGAASGTPSSDFKAELLSLLRVEMAAIFKTELQAALTENLSNIKTEMQAVKSELTGSITKIQSEIRAMKDTVGEMETSLSTCTDDISTPQAKVECLSADLIRLDNKCSLQYPFFVYCCCFLLSFFLLFLSSFLKVHNQLISSFSLKT